MLLEQTFWNRNPFYLPPVPLPSLSRPQGWMFKWLEEIPLQYIGGQPTTEETWEKQTKKQIFCDFYLKYIPRREEHSDFHESVCIYAFGLTLVEISLSFMKYLTERIF